ncbi:MAG: hypothetical protein AB1679_00210 [Actinomycetota bacterium]
MDRLVEHVTLNPKTIPRLLALAQANEAYATKLQAEGRLDESNVYWGQSLGILACIEMLAAEYTGRD